MMLVIRSYSIQPLGATINATPLHANQLKPATRDLT